MVNYFTSLVLRFNFFLFPAMMGLIKERVVLESKHTLIKHLRHVGGSLIYANL